MRLRLALADDLSQQCLERLHVIVLEHPDICTTQTNAESNRRVVQLVRNDQTTLADQRRDDRRVRRKAHRTDQRVLLADEPRDKCLRLRVQVQAAALEARPARGDAVLHYGRLHRVRTGTPRLREPEVIVRRDVQSPRPGPRGHHRLIVVGRVAV